MKKLVIAILIIALMMPFFEYRVNAESTVIEVDTVEAFEMAISTIQGASNANYTISLIADIEITEDTVIPTAGNTINNGNTVTLLGNGHNLVISTFSKGRLAVSGGTLNLGLESGNNILCINGCGQNNSGASESVMTVTNGTINMYNGVTITNDNIEYGAVVGGAVNIKTNGVFNMYGGVMERCTSPSVAGGAIMMDYDNGTFNMSGGEIRNNSSIWGGAIYISANSVINITGGTISGNSATYGGAIGATAGQITIKNATLTQNTSTEYGGAILSYGSPNVTMENNTITANESKRGGAIANWGNEFTLKNNLIEGNSGTYGGAIRNLGTLLTSENNTIKNNTSNGIGGAIYSSTSMTSAGDDITLNTANYGGGVGIVAGTADFATSKVYNNKAQVGGSDFYISENATSINIMEASDFDKTATIDDTTTLIDGWYTDYPDDDANNIINRYSLTNYTEKVVASEITAGNEYFLIAATNKFKVIYDNDGKDSTENVVKRFAKGSKIKINANGGQSTVEEIELANDIVIDNPTRANYKFKGWEIEEVEGYAFGLKATWQEKATYTVTFKVVNGTWADGTTTDKTLTLTENEEEKVILKYEDFPVGMIANENYENGTWNNSVTSDIELTGDVTYTYSYTQIPEEKEKYTVTFKVVNGTWADGTTADKILEIEENDEGKIILKKSNIPTGMKANAKYKNGSWDNDMSADIELSKDTTYTYSFVREYATYTVTFKVINGTWADGTTADKKIKITANDEDVATLKTTDIPTGMIANANCKDGKWDKITDKDVKLTGDSIYTFTFEKEETEIDDEHIGDDSEEIEIPEKPDSQDDGDNIGDSDSDKKESTTGTTEYSKENEKQENRTIPKTNDNIPMYFMAFIISIATMYFIKLEDINKIKSRSRRKKKMKHHSKH